ncbi:EamA family transporter [Effusibacillus consociatus]|uniref:EamA family transporter n=1 Tax=Effusibacillus consociatus TaxID=1117041 RepID=A0ABV9PY16_9BACL
MNRLTASFLVLLGAASYGLISPIVKMAYDAGFTPQDVTSSQYAFSLLVLAGLIASRWNAFRKLTRRDVRLLSFLGILGTGTSIFYYVSLEYLPASLAIVLLFQFAWIVMVIDYLVTRKKPSPVKWLSLAFIMIGTMFAVNLFETDWSRVSAFGLLLGLLSSVTYGLFLFWNGKVESKAPAIINSFVIASASLVSISIVFPPKFLWNGTLGEGLWIWALMIGCLGQVIPPILFNKGIPVVGGSLAGLLASIELPVAVVAALLLLKESVTLSEWLGIGLIVTGIIVAEVMDRELVLKLEKAHE